MSVGGTVAVAIAIAFFLVACFGCLARRSFIKFEREAELNAPLIDSEDRRLDAALRDAEEGFNVCRVCQFENFKRFRYCTVCGEPIEAGEADDEGLVGNTKKAKKLSSLRTLFKRGRHVQLTSSAPASSLSKQVTRRRLRAQRRKEWTRKVDVEGRTYWFRDNRFVKTGGEPSTAFVVTFKTASNGSGALEIPPESQQQPSELMTSDEESLPESADREILSDTMPSPVYLSTRDAGAPASPSAPEPDPELEGTLEGGDLERIVPYRPTIGSVEDCIAKLMRSARELQPALTQASDTSVNASRLPLTLLIGPNLTTSDIAQDDALHNAPASGAVAEAMGLACKDFPSKYAHFVMAASSLLVPVWYLWMLRYWTYRHQQTAFRKSLRY